MEGSDQEAPLLALFDLYWFRRSVLRSGHLVLVGADAGCGCAPAAEPPLLIWEPTRLRNPLSGEVALATSSDSALLAHHAPVFSRILSGKSTPEKEEEEEEEEEEEHGKISARAIGVTERQGRRWWRRGPARGAGRRGRRSKSLSELEFEELKGFMDLGFTFSGAEDDQRLLSIIPGLQRLGKRLPSEEEAGLGAKAEAEEDGAGESEPIPRRPYLSEAWEVVGLDDRSWRGNAYDDLLRNWRVPAPGEGVDMKQHLRCWAHAVASAVR